jgi:hypothetical protein
MWYLKNFRKSSILILSIILILLSATNSGISDPISFEYSNEIEYWGVIIGISDYKGQKNDLPVSSTHLKKLYTTLLTSSNWKEDHILLLINEDAHQQNILAALEWLANKSDENDIVLFSFQGHGSSIEDSNEDEIDGYDEGIVAWEGLDGLIIDDVLDSKFDTISHNGLFLIFHSCLSGGLLDVRQKPTQYTHSLQTDITDINRVILVSSQDHGLALAFPSITRQLAYGLQGSADSQDNGNTGDGIITAEEAATFAKNRVNAIILGLLLLFPPAIISIIISELIAKSFHGYWILPFPIIYDSYPDELPIFF